ncbi:MAG: hypothetical protein LCH69_06570 [Proteobacteria bacterium]|nr:hypothetical protein [Pseudomonadota bacterium]
MLYARSVGLAAAFAATLSGPSLAEPLTGGEIKAFFQAGAFDTDVGSTFDFRSDGTFSVSNADGAGYAGTWTVDAEGLVKAKRKRAAKPDLFYIDKNAGSRTMVITAGRFKGRKFQLS